MRGSPSDDRESGNHLWAEGFDKPIADLFDMQDQILARLANALDAKLRTAEARRANSAPTLGSMDNKVLIPGNIAHARRYFDLALARPRFSRRSR
jgi:hypothetical protein